MSAKRTGKKNPRAADGEPKMVRYTMDQIRCMPDRLDNREWTDEEIDAAIASDPDAAPPLDDAWFARARLVRLSDLIAERKKPVSIRLDQKILDWFKAQGPRYQSRINAVLRAYIESRQAQSKPAKRSPQKRNAGHTNRDVPRRRIVRTASVHQG